MKKYAKNFFATLNPANSPVVILSGGGDWASAGFALPSAAPDLRNNSLNAIFSRPLSPTIFLPVTALGASFGSVADGLRSSNGAAFASSLVPRATASRYVLRSGFEKKTYPAFVLHQPSVKPLARA